MADLSREESNRMRSIGRETAARIARIAETAARSYGMSRSFATVSKVNSDGTVEVDFGNSSHAMNTGSIRTTVDCAGVRVGDVVVVDTFSYVPLVTGIVSTGKNGVLTVSHGGTGANSASAAFKNLSGYALELGTNNTVDTWVPVLGGNANSGKIVHRDIPTAYNSTPLAVSAGGTGATNAGGARANLAVTAMNGPGLTNAWVGVWNGNTSDPGYRLETCWFVNGVQRGLCVDTYNRLRFYGANVNEWSLGNLSGDKDMTPVYRLYNSYNGMHHWVTSQSEYNSLVSQGWTGEGIVFYAFK
jgi:hypothetical protein